MRDVVIEVDRLGKQYRLGQLQPYKALRNKLANVLQSPLRVLNSATSYRRSGVDSSPSNQFIWALKDASFQVERGEVVGIIGLNGAGKSTLLKILSRITEPTEGRAKIIGRVGSLLEVGTGFNAELTGRENIYLNGAILGMRRAEIGRKLEEIVDFAGVEDFLDTPIKRYSSGMNVRLAFAVAAHLEPEILLVDEVLAVGDVLFQKKCLGKLSEVAGEGRTVLFVSHNMATMAALTNRCILLKDGHIIADGDTPKIISQYSEESTFPGHNGVVDLRQAIRRTGNQFPTIHLTELTMTEINGNPKGLFCEGDPIRLTISFEITRAITQFELTCTVSTIDRVRLFSIASSRRLWDACPGSYSISTVLDPNQLRPGTYTVSLGVYSSVWQDGGYEVASFEIVDNPTQKEKHYPLNGDFGLFSFPYKWNDPAPSVVAASHKTSSESVDGKWLT